MYRPLYHCTAKKDRFEAHHLAVSHFSRWNEKFTKVENIGSLPLPVKEMLLPGPFWKDPSWEYDTHTAESDNAGRSGLGTRSHESVKKDLAKEM